MSRVVEFAEAGGPEVLTFKNVDVPKAGPGQVRIRVKAIGLNRAESMWRHNQYIEPVKFPARLGYEAVGNVDSVGRDITTIAVGDEVNVIPSFSMNQYGMYGEVVLAPIHAVVRQPKGLSPLEAASIWMMFITAYGALIGDAKITSEDAVVIPGASSSVGLAAIQISNSVGAKSIALTRTSAKRKHLTDAGAKYVIATEEEDLVKAIDEITGGQGARVVFDPVGGPTVPKLIKTMSFQGLLYLYGALSDQVTTVPPLDLIAKILTIKGYNIWTTSGDAQRQKAAVDFVLAGLEKGTLKPVIDKVFPFDQIVEAHRYLEASGQFGKIVVTI
ncbi:MAG TPA: zinc-dependent alcohol dehydrogenase family protein [Candidatus Binataceae bacterium]